MRRTVAERFPGAAILDEAAFAAAVVGRIFRYRDPASGIVVNYPGELFVADGHYQTGHRAIAHGSWSIARGIVSIDCPQSFLGLGMKRLFFRHQGRLLTTETHARGTVWELIEGPEPTPVLPG